eukprot:c20545_g1_i1.p1 GENE.c20545_g1_i1~~c20545_g1_i1.p1  ORF type:complete len:729 (+),score=150.86 c20545_g1_i1:48-2189(+)
MSLDPTKLKVPDLKNELKSRGIDVAGLKKADLVIMLQEAIEGGVAPTAKEEHPAQTRRIASTRTKSAPKRLDAKLLPPKDESDDESEDERKPNTAKLKAKKAVKKSKKGEDLGDHDEEEEEEEESKPKEKAKRGRKPAAKGDDAQIVEKPKRGKASAKKFEDVEGDDKAEEKETKTNPKRGRKLANNTEEEEPPKKAAKTSAKKGGGRPKNKVNTKVDKSFPVVSSQSVQREESNAKVRRMNILWQEWNGVDPFSQSTLQRPELVSEIYELANRFGVVLLKSPPGSGKTSLLCLLQAHALEQNMPFVLISSATLGSGFLSPAQLIQRATADAQFVFLDDCQMLCDDTELWDWVFKTLQNKKFVLAATYDLATSPGSPTFQTVLKFDRLRLTDEESRDYLQHHLPEKYQSLDNFLAVTIEQCSGHVAILKHVVTYFESLDIEESESQLIRILLSSAFSDSCCRVWQKPLHLQLTAANLNIFRMLMIGAISQDQEAIKLKRLLVRAFVVVDSPGLSLEFYSPIAFRRFQACLFPQRASNFPPNTTIDDLILRVVQLLPPDLLAQGCENAEKGPKETTYQHLFHLGLAQSTMSNQEIVADMPNSLAKRGSASFFLNSNLLCWAFELVRNSDHLEEHLARFEPGGRHALEWVKDYRVVDFVVNRESAAFQPKCVAVELLDNFTRACLVRTVEGGVQEQIEVVLGSSPTSEQFVLFWP